jgi:hypothetical protein
VTKREWLSRDIIYGDASSAVITERLSALLRNYLLFTAPRWALKRRLDHLLYRLSAARSPKNRDLPSGEASARRGQRHPKVRTQHGPNVLTKWRRKDTPQTPRHRWFSQQTFTEGRPSPQVLGGRSPRGMKTDIRWWKPAVFYASPCSADVKKRWRWLVASSVWTGDVGVDSRWPPWEI